MKRKRITKRQSRKIFRSGARKTHRNNLRPAPQRGGFRL